MPNSLSQEQKLEQRQIATQQMIRLMQLVELPYLSLEQEILKEVEENPALEVVSEEEDYHTEESPSAEEYDENGDPLELSNDLSDEDIFNEDFYRDDDLDDYPTEREIENQIARLNAPEAQDGRDSVGVFRNSQREQWQLQLGEMVMTEKESLLANYLMGNLDDGGYFVSDMQTMVNDLICYYNVYTNAAELEDILKRFIQELDPPGTGARNLQECLLLQLARLPEQTAPVQLAKRILEDCFDAFAMKHYDRIAQSLSVNKEQLRSAMNVITKLDPRPADAGNDLEKLSDVITPDFTITSTNGKLTLALNNQYVPKVRINKEFSNEYRFLSNEKADKKRQEAEKFMKAYVDKADQFINTLTLREKIMYNTMFAIMNHQRDYFLTGDDVNLKPMILKDVAAEVGLDISTISRFSNSKYVQTDFGIISVKHLFSEAVNDEETSSKVIKSILSDLIASENKHKPLSDDKLCDLLNKKGYDIARRTVAKYREQLNLPVARLRKEV